MSSETHQDLRLISDPALELAERVGNSGSWRVDLPDEKFTCSSGLLRILGLDRDQCPGTVGVALGQYTHPDDFDVVRESEVAHSQGLPWEGEHRIKRSNGDVRWVHSSTLPLFGDDGGMVAVVGFIQDITDKRTTDQVLQDLTDSFRATFEQAAVGIAHAGPDRTWLRINQRLCGMLGYPMEELMELTFADLTHPDDVASSLENFGRILAGEQDTYDAEKRYLRKDGSVMYANLSAAAVRNEDGTFAYLVSVIEDISDKVEAQQALKMEVDKFTSAFRTSPDAVNINRMSDGLYVEVNEGFTRLTGYTPEDVAGKTSADIAIWTDMADRAMLVEGLRQHGQVDNLEAVFRRKDGSVTTALMSARIINVEGETCILSVTRDIAERKAAEVALRERSEMVRLLLDSTVEGIHGLDLQGRISFCNPASLKMLGYEDEDAILGRIGHEVYHHTRSDGAPYPVTECPILTPTHGTELVHRDDEVFWRADGTSFPVEYWSHPLLDEGELVGWVVTFVDITERQRLEEAMQRRIVALTQPPASTGGVTFADLFDLDEIQAIQDAFAEATGVGSMITTPDGTPLTRPSNFCRLCKDVIRGTEKGRVHCAESDAAIGCHDQSGPVVSPCLSGGLWDAGASITAGGEHVANWLIGQVRNDELTQEEMLAYADEIGADRDEFLSALAEVNPMPLKQFERIADALFAFANELSVIAYQNVQQARFITEQQRVEQEVRALNKDLEARAAEKAVLVERLGAMVTSVIDVVGDLSEMRDPYTAGHQRRVAELAAAIASEMGMSEPAVEEIRVAGLLHDIGKMSVPAEILSKPSSLSPSEFSLVRGHADAGHDIIASAHMEGPIAAYVWEHHERCDGSGYPRGRKASQLLEGSKVLMVADVVEAMMSHRPYRPALGVDAALAEVEQGAGCQYDSQVVESCVRLFREREFEFSEV